MKSIFSHFLYTGVGITGIVMATLFSSCTDEDPITISDNTRFIHFSVNTSNDNFLTRSQINEPLDILSLKGDRKIEKPLYLVPIIEDNFNENKNEDATRSLLTDSSNMESFGVYAGYVSESGTTSYNPNYMSNVEISRSLNWSPASEYLWPGEGALHFNAYSPYFSGEPANGINGINILNGSLLLDYATPEQVADQKDLLFATPTNASSSPCQLTFNHALTAIKFVSGAEMAPCTIKSISISGVNSTGTLDLETGLWSDLDGESSFIVEPNVNLSATNDSKYVASGTQITNSEQTFLLLPQNLGENALLTIVVSVDGQDTTLTTSLSGQEFPEGKCITYRISANPAADSLILNVTGDFKTEYTGSSISFNVKSSLNEGGNQTPVRWIAEFVDDSGNVIAPPNWISNITLEGTGNTVGNITTVMQDIEFHNMTNATRKLQTATDINKSSGNNPYNLSSNTGSSSIENTANTYIINAPGSYSLPLVYGNAIKNGSDNKQSYAPSTHNAHALKAFTNHLDNAISSPYIYENSGCSPSDAVLIWEDELNLVRNVKLSSDGKAILFDVPQNTIRQGNAMLAVRDANKNVMWSWQIWVTDYNPSSGTQNLTVSGKSYSLASANLGYVSGGDQFSFPEQSVKIRFTQTGLPDDMEPLSQTIILTQTGIELSTPDYNPYYQWGRKDPMMSGDKQYYNAAHQEIKTHPLASAADLSSTKNLMQEYILNPDTFFTGSHDSDESSTNYTTYPYDNFWDGTYSTANPKTIYDPNPVGFEVPYNEPLLDFTPQSSSDPTSRYSFRYNASSNATEKRGFYITVKSTGDVLFFPDFGYISGATGSTVSGKEMADYWLSHAISTLKTGGIVQFYTTSTDITAQQTTDPLFHGMSIRAIKEQ